MKIFVDADACPVNSRRTKEDEERFEESFEKLIESANIHNGKGGK